MEKLMTSGKIWAAIGNEQTLFFRLSPRRLGGYYVYHLGDGAIRIGYVDSNDKFHPEDSGKVAQVYFPFVWDHRHNLPDGLEVEDRQYGMRRHTKDLYRKAKSHQVDSAGAGGQFIVKSGSSGSEYRVWELANGGFQCTCKWAEYRETWKRPCSHCLAVEMYLEEAGGRSLHFFPTEEDAQRQKQRQRQVGLGIHAVSRC